MNDSATYILLQLEARKRLLLSLETSGFFVLYKEDTHLCSGIVCGAWAVVPVEHAITMSSKHLAAMRSRGLEAQVEAMHLRPMAEVVAEELLQLETEAAWVAECGGGMG